MRTKPSSSYNGLTIVLSQPSRFDDKNGSLLSGYAGHYFDEKCLTPHYISRHQCDIRTMDSLGDGLLPNTKAILLLGEPALHSSWTKLGAYTDYTLGEQRGCPLDQNFDPSIIMVATYLPQDAMDMVDYESQFNTHITNRESTDDKTTDDEDAIKHKGKTSRSNYKFWMQRDCGKLIRRMRSKELSWETSRASDFKVNIYPNLDEVNHLLRTTKNAHLYLDIETDSNFNLTCIGLSFGDVIYTLPITRYDYTLAYSNLHTFFCALAIALRDNIVVIHNSMFDLFVLAHQYKLPFGQRVFDTMLSTHRCFPEAEKSLGHAMSLWTWEDYHKDEGVFEPKNTEMERRLWNYNAKDVAGMILIHKAIVSYAARIPGLPESIEQANGMVYPYLVNTMYGMRYDVTTLDGVRKENDRWMTQYLRILTVLVGHELLPTSTKQVRNYLFDEMDYPSYGRTDTGDKATGGETLLKLRLKFPTNSVIQLLLDYRDKAKESGSLKFIPWKTEPVPRNTCSWGVGITKTFRNASKKLLSEWGTNLQNPSNNIKRIYIPDEGKIFVQADQSGAEALIVAYLCRDGNFRELFKQGIKPHVFVGLHLFQSQFEKHLNISLQPYVDSSIAELKTADGWKEAEKVIKDSDSWPAERRYYFIAKMFCHASNYAATAGVLQKHILVKSDGQVVITKKDAEYGLEKYHSLFLELRAWHRETEDILRRSAELRNIFGYPRKFYGLLSNPEVLKEALAFIPQSTVGTITNMAFVEIQDWIENNRPETNDWDLLSNTHDSIIMQVPIGEELLAASVLKAHLERKMLSPRGEEFQMKSEVSVGYRWCKYDKDEAPDGMKEIKV
jgi:DNA polymerase I-like protein with 3'-5' exonuclease and polymerase domains